MRNFTWVSVSRFLFHIVVHSSSATLSDGLSRLTAHFARLTTHVSLLTAPSSRWLLLAQGGRGGHSVRARLRAVTLPGPLVLFPSPASSHHHSRIPSFALSIAVCALPRVCLSPCRCLSSVLSAVSSSSAVPCSSSASSTGSPRPFPLTYHVLVSPRTSLAHVASAQIFCLSLPHHVSVLIRRIRRVAPRPSVTVSAALLFVLTLSASARASPAASLSALSPPSLYLFDGTLAVGHDQDPLVSQSPFTFLAPRFQVHPQQRSEYRSKRSRVPQNNPPPRHPTNTSMAVEAALLPLESQQPVPVFGHVDVAVNNPPRWATTHPGGHDEHEAAAATLATLAATPTVTII